MRLGRKGDKRVPHLRCQGERFEPRDGEVKAPRNNELK